MAKERPADDLAEGQDGLPDSKVADTIGEWQEHLLQVDRRNNLLYFKGKAPVRLLIESIDDFLTSLSTSKSGLAFLYAERRWLQTDQEDDDEPDVYTVPGDIDADCAPLDLQKRLKNLRKRDREWEEEQGLNVDRSSSQPLVFVV